jgi:hypothetical protein
MVIRKLYSLLAAQLARLYIEKNFTETEYNVKLKKI